MKRRMIRVPPLSVKATVEYTCDECGCLFRTIPFTPCTRPLCDSCIGRGHAE